jgi:hypothetical protein
MSMEHRRKAAERAFERARKLGLIVENDAAFLGWVNEWIDGQLTMRELRERYLALLGERNRARRSDPNLPQRPSSESVAPDEALINADGDEGLGPGPRYRRRRAARQKRDRKTRRRRNRPERRLGRPRSRGLIV